jgi:hypothetical protein
MTNGIISISPLSIFLTYIAIFQFFIYLHMMLISRSWFGMQELVRHMICFLNSGQSTDNQVNIMISTVLFTGSFPQNLRSLQRSSLPVQLSFRPNAVWCVSHQPSSWSLHTDGGYGLYHLPDLELGFTAGVTGRQGILTPPKHPDPTFSIARGPCLSYSQICITYRACEIDDWSLFMLSHHVQ